MSDRGGLSRSARGGDRRRAQTTGGASPHEAAANLSGDIELAARERAGPIDRISTALIVYSFRFDKSQHAFRAVRRPSGNEPPFRFAQRLWRSHTESLSRARFFVGGSMLVPRTKVDGRPPTSSRNLQIEEALVHRRNLASQLARRYHGAWREHCC